MDPFALLYILYTLKLSIQAAIYIIWQVDSTSGTITYLYAGASALAGVPLFHVIAHVCYKRSLLGLAFVLYAVLR